MFVGLLRTDGTAVPDADRSRYSDRLRALALASEVDSGHVDTINAGEFVGLVAPAVVPLRPLSSRRHSLVGVGNVRLDHGDEVRRWSDSDDRASSDFDLVLAAVESRGARCIPDILGDFAFVIWDVRTRTLIAARDAFGTRTLFVGQRGPLLVVSSRLELVHESDALDEEYLADFLLTGDPGPTRTIWADSQAIAQGSIRTWHDGRPTTECYWDPFTFEPTDRSDARQQIEEFRVLFRESVRTRLAPGGRTWAELSGGVDSSSIVSMAQTLVDGGESPARLAGTVTIVDELGGGNEQRFSDLVVERYRLPNAKVMNPWPWQEDGRVPPKTDEPRTHYPFFARDRRICAIVRAAGGQVLLSGFGSDHYLYGSRLYLADLVGRGHFARAFGDVARWAVVEQRSFWKELLRYVVSPYLPALTPHPIGSVHTVPDWIDPTFAKRLSMRERLPALRGARGPRGRKFGHYIASSMQEVVRWLPRASFEDGLELRYPFFYRPLVECGLRLPPTMRAQPLAPKWILREAMTGVLPEPIRTRTGKGSIDARLNWGFLQERERLTEILSESALASLGVLRPDRVNAALDQTAHGGLKSVVTLLAALSIETWLFVRSDRWVVRTGPAATALDRQPVYQA